MTRNGLFTIGEFSKVTGIGIHSLRYYDEIGALKPEYVDPASNYRYYGIRQLSMIPAINICRESGINLGDLSSYISDDSIDYSRLLNESRESLEIKINEFRHRQHQLSQMEKLLSIRSALEEGQSANIWIDDLSLWSIPCGKAASVYKESDILMKLSREARKRGCSISPVAYGLLSADDAWDSDTLAFSLISSDEAVREDDPHVIHLAPGRYLIVPCSDLSIVTARKALSSYSEGPGPETGGSGMVFAACMMSGDHSRPIICAGGKYPD